MSEMKLWGARDNSGSSNLIRAATKPEKLFGKQYTGSDAKGWLILQYRGTFSDLACRDVLAGDCRQIKSLDLANWTVEYVPDPPTLKEAWEEYQVYDAGNFKFGGPFQNLIEALKREFPDD